MEFSPLWTTNTISSLGRRNSMNSGAPPADDDFSLHMDESSSSKHDELLMAAGEAFSTFDAAAQQELMTAFDNHDHATTNMSMNNNHAAARGTMPTSSSFKLASATFQKDDFRQTAQFDVQEQSTLRTDRNDANMMINSISSPSRVMSSLNASTVAASRGTADGRSVLASDTEQDGHHSHRPGMLAKQTLLARMYQNRSVRRASGGAASGKAPSSPGSKRVFDDSTKRQTVRASSSVSSTTTASSITPSSQMSADSLLHNTCKLYPTNLDIVRSALHFDPQAIRRAVPLATDDNDSQDSTIPPPSKRVKSASAIVAKGSVVYPINIALQHQASQNVVEFLALAGPDVLVQKDGPGEACALAIALGAGCPNKILRTLLAANPQQAQVTDRKNGYPLHIAVGLPTVSLEMVKIIFKAYPGALLKPNVRGDTPVQVAERNPYCREDIVDYLQEQAYSPFEAKAVHLNDDELADIEPAP